MIKFSDNIKSIASAICKFQGLVTNPKKSADNPFFKTKYATLDEIITTARPVLSSCGLSFIQNVLEDEQGRIGVYTMLLHVSGESLTFDPVYVPLEKKTAQGIGAAITYAKRYSLGTALGIATDEDDDGNSIEPTKKRHTKPKAEPKAKAETIKELETKWEQGGGNPEELNNWVKKKYKKDVNDLTETEANDIINIIEQSINKRQAKQETNDSNKMTSKQRETIFGKGKGKGLTQPQIKKLAYHYCQLDSMKKMTNQQADELIKLMSDREMTGRKLLELSGQVDSEKNFESNRLTETDKQELITGFENGTQNMQVMGANSY